MRKEVLQTGRMLSKEYFRIFVEDNKKDLSVLEDDADIMGFKEFEEDDIYVVLLRLPKLKECYLEMTFIRSNGKLKGTNLFRKVNL